MNRNTPWLFGMLAGAALAASSCGVGLVEPLVNDTGRRSDASRPDVGAPAPGLDADPPSSLDASSVAAVDAAAPEGLDASTPVGPDAAIPAGPDAATPAEPDAATPAGPDAATPAGPDAASPFRPLTVAVTASGGLPLPAGAYVAVDGLHQGTVDAAGTIAWSDVPAMALTVTVTAPDCGPISQAIDAVTTSVQIFVTCTPAGVDSLDVSQASVYNSPPDIAGWAVTTAITRLDFTSDGIHVEFDKSDGTNRWPDVTPPGWDGPIQYTLWLALNVNGQWDASGIIQFWYGLPASGGDVTQNDQVAINWVYDGRWGPMQGHQPAVGELVGFFVAAGNERGVPDASQTLVSERSNMVTVPFPASSGVSFTF